MQNYIIYKQFILREIKNLLIFREPYFQKFFNNVHINTKKNPLCFYASQWFPINIKYTLYKIILLFKKYTQKREKQRNTPLCTRTPRLTLLCACLWLLDNNLSTRQTPCMYICVFNHVLPYCLSTQHKINKLKFSIIRTQNLLTKLQCSVNFHVIYILLFIIKRIIIIKKKTFSHSLL